MRFGATFFIHPNQLYLLSVCLSSHYVEMDLESAPPSSSVFAYLANVNSVPLSYLWLLIQPESCRKWKCRKRSSRGCDCPLTHELDPCSQAPHPSPVLGMYVLPTVPTVWAFSRAQPWDSRCCWDHLDGICDWNHLRPPHKLSRYWLVSTEIYLSYGLPDKSRI